MPFYLFRLILVSVSVPPFLVLGRLLEHFLEFQCDFFIVFLSTLLHVIFLVVALGITHRHVWSTALLCMVLVVLIFLFVEQL